MVEVLFGESEAGSMKAAKGNHPVICLGFLLDIGRIDVPVDSKCRKEIIYSAYTQFQWGKDEEMLGELKELGTHYVHELQRLKEFLEQGETVRIWYSNNPYSRCGFYHLCQILLDYDNPVTAVGLPEHIQNGKVIVNYRSWGEVCPEEFAKFLIYEKELTKNAQKRYAQFWQELVEENSPLRAVINGRVIGVEENFYDFLIWRMLSTKPVKQARLIGNILGTYSLGIGDWWYAARIEHFIRQGRILVVEDSENRYARVIRGVE